MYIEELIGLAGLLLGSLVIVLITYWPRWSDVEETSRDGSAQAEFAGKPQEPGV
jgi:hypothetical protein